MYPNVVACLSKKSDTWKVTSYETAKAIHDAQANDVPYMPEDILHGADEMIILRTNGMVEHMITGKGAFAMVDGPQTSSPWGDKKEETTADKPIVVRDVSQRLLRLKSIKDCCRIERVKED